MTADDVNPYILTPEERARWKDRIASMRNEGLFTPPASTESLVAAGSARRLQLGHGRIESPLDLCI